MRYSGFDQLFVGRGDASCVGLMDRIPTIRNLQVILHTGAGKWREDATRDRPMMPCFAFSNAFTCRQEFIENKPALILH